MLYVGRACVCSVISSGPTLCDSKDCSSPCSSVHGILQARILAWVAICLLQGIFSTQGSKLRLLRLLLCRPILYLLSHREGRAGGAHAVGYILVALFISAALGLCCSPWALWCSTTRTGLSLVAMGGWGVAGGLSCCGARARVRRHGGCSMGFSTCGASA